MIVSLEAIFLCVRAVADQQWQTVKEEDRQNEELVALSRQILDLTKAIHAETPPRPAAQALAAGNAAVAAVWHRRRAGFVAQTSAPSRR